MAAEWAGRDMAREDRGRDSAWVAAVEWAAVAGGPAEVERGLAALAGRVAVRLAGRACGSLARWRERLVEALGLERLAAEVV